MKKAVRITIKGGVQGVSFREFVKENAFKLGIKGFVRNLENGNVEVIAEGDIDNVDYLFQVCKKGSKNAVIKDATMTEGKFQDFKEFKILHI